jgi:hypothetical protein
VFACVHVERVCVVPVCSAGVSVRMYGETHTCIHVHAVLRLSPQSVTPPAPDTHTVHMLTYRDRPLTLLSSKHLSLLNSRVGADALVRDTEAELDANAYSLYSF